MKDDMTFTEEEDRLLSYMTYTVFYANDMLCNLIKDAEPYVADKDKETKKIYGALLRRANNYLHEINTFLLPVIYRISEYFAYMDDLVDESVINYEKELEKVFERNGVEDAVFLAKIEVIRSLSDNAIVSLDTFLSESTKVTQKAHKIKQYRLTDINRVANNLAKWVSRHVDSVIDLNKEDDAYEALTTLCNNLFNANSYYGAMKYAKEEEERRLNGECLC